MDVNGHYVIGLPSASAHYGSGGGNGDEPSSVEEQQQQRWPVDAVPVAAAARAVRPNQKRTKNFSDKEDEMLALAWLNVSSDPGPAHGGGGGGERAPYWKRMHDYFHGHRDFESERSENSLLHRWSTIQDNVKRFDRCVADVLDGHGHGQDDDDDHNSLTPHDTVTLTLRCSILSSCSWFASFCDIFFLFHCRVTFLLHCFVCICRWCRRWLCSSLRTRTTSRSSSCTAGTC